MLRLLVVLPRHVLPSHLWQEACRVRLVRLPLLMWRVHRVHVAPLLVVRVLHRRGVDRRVVQSLSLSCLLWNLLPLLRLRWRCLLMLGQLGLGLGLQLRVLQRRPLLGLWHWQMLLRELLLRL